MESEVSFPLLQSFSYFPFTEGVPLDKGQFSVRLSWYYSNIFMFNHERTTLNDFEMSNLTMALRYGISRKGTIEVYIRYSSIFPGILDRVIDDFHQTFQIPDTNRHEFPRFKVHYWFQGRFVYTDSQHCLSPLVVAFLKQWYQRNGFSVSTRLAVGIPFSSKPGFSSEKPFLTGGLELVYASGGFSVAYSHHLSFFKSPRWLQGEYLRSYIHLSRLQINFRRFMGGLAVRTSPFKDGDVAHPGWQGYVGYRIFKNFEFVIIEDFAPFDTTPDISFLFRWQVTFPTRVQSLQ